MDDHPPSRRLRVFLAGLLLALVWGCAASAAEEARSESSGALAVVRSSAPRAAAGRPSLPLPVLPPLGAAPAVPEVPAGEGSFLPRPEPDEPRPSAPPAGAASARAPPL